MTSFNPATFIGKISQKRQPSAIRALKPLLQIPGMLSLGSGEPNSETFPFSKISFQLKNGTEVSLSEEETNQALQYTITSGLPSLVSWGKEFQQREHSPQYSDWDVCFGTGSQDVLTRAFDMLLDEGDSVLLDSPVYSGTLAYLQPRDLDLLPVPTDSQGLILSELRKILESNKARKKPKVLVTIPTGGNPTGSTMPLERRKELLAIAKEHDLVIIEDDPYYFLSFGDFPLSGEFDRNRLKLPSLLSLDTDGRVIRTDSFSKILSSGIRVGWVTAHAKFIERITLAMQCTELHASAVSQALVAKLFETWGHDGLERHLNDVGEFYGKKRDNMESIVQDLLSDHCDWATPSAGLFYWLKTKQYDDTHSLIYDKAQAEKVILLPGNVFDPDGEKSPYVRAAFSALPEEKLREAVSRFARVLEANSN